MNTIEIDKSILENWVEEQNLFELQSWYARARRIVNAGGTCSIIRHDKVMNISFTVHDYHNLQDFDNYYQELTKYLS